VTGVSITDVEGHRVRLCDNPPRTSQEMTHTNITMFGDAIWWSAATITTVGYGDRYPTTSAGRTIALGLMLAGRCRSRRWRR
jgi:voltage-gated potassium channel Kch